MLSHETQNRLSSLGFSALQHDNVTDFRKSVAKELEVLFNASSSAFFHWARSGNNPESVQENDVYFPHWDESQKKQYLHQIRPVDPVIEWLHTGSYTKTNGVVRITSLVRPKDYLQSALYQEFLRPLRTHYILTLAFSSCNDLIGNVSLLRPVNAADFSKEEEELARLAVPMLSAAYSRLLLTEKLALYKSVTNLLEKEHTNHAIYLFDFNLNCISQTKGAEILNTFLAQNSVISISHVALQSSVIKRYIERCRKKPDKNRPTALAGVTDRVKLSQDSVITLCLQSIVDEAHQPMFMLTAATEQLNFDLMDARKKYGLTKRESEIFEYLRKGHNSIEIGSRLNISQWTVKNHLHTIYHKVGVRNRTALVNRIMGCH